MSIWIVGLLLPVSILAAALIARKCGVSNRGLKWGVRFFYLLGALAAAVYILLMTAGVAREAGIPLQLPWWLEPGTYSGRQ